MWLDLPCFYRPCWRWRWCWCCVSMLVTVCSEKFGICWQLGCLDSVFACDSSRQPVTACEYSLASCMPGHIPAISIWKLLRREPCTVSTVAKMRCSSLSPYFCDCYSCLCTSQEGNGDSAQCQGCLLQALGSVFHLTDLEQKATVCFWPRTIKVLRGAVLEDTFWPRCL